MIVLNLKGYTAFLSIYTLFDCTPEKIAFDLNPDLKQFANKDVLTVSGSFFELKNCLKGEKADVIFASNVMEHLDSKEQVIQAIKTFYDNLKNGGRLLILQPNI